MFPQWALPLRRPHNHQLRAAIVTANWRGCEGRFWELDEVGVPKPFAIIEKRNDLGADPDQEETFFPGQCVSQDLGKLPEHKLAHAIDLIRVSHWLRRPTYGQ